MSDKIDFILERYKYIMTRKRDLNEASLKITTIYQAAIALLFPGQFNVFSYWKSGLFTKELAISASVGLLILLFAVTVLNVALFIGGIAAWFKYRKDEAAIEREVLGSARKAPSIGSVLTWYETYLVMVVICIGVVGSYCSLFLIMPAIKS